MAHDFSMADDEHISMLSLSNPSRQYKKMNRVTDAKFNDVCLALLDKDVINQICLEISV